MMIATKTLKEEINAATAMDSRGMLVSLHIHTYGNRKKSKDADAVVGEHFEIDEEDRKDAGRFTKNPVDKKALAGINNAFGAIKREHYKRTLPWLDDGQRILSNKGYFDYLTAIGDKTAAAMREVSKVADNWDSIVAAAMLKRRGLVKLTDYPTAEQFRQKYSVSKHIFPMPKAEDFRADLPKDQVDQIIEDIEESRQAAFRNATVEIAQRIKLVAHRAYDRLTKYQPAEEGKAKRVKGNFTKTLTSNIAELADLLPTLNITADPQIDAIERELRAMARHSSDDLKKDAKLRKTTADQAAAILKKMEAFV